MTKLQEEHAIMIANIGAGRKPAVKKLPTKIRKLVREYDVKAADVGKIIKYLLFVCDIPKLKEHLQDDKMPAFIRFTIKGLLSDFQKGKMDIVNNMMNRALGLPKVEIEQTNLNFDVDVNKLNPEQARTALAQMVARYNENKDSEMRDVTENEENDD